MSTCKPSEQYLTKLRERYRRARKKERGRILDEFVATTGYHRKHAVALLRGKRRHRNLKTPIRRVRRRIYLAEDKRAVLWLAELFDQIGSKRLRVAMDVELDNLRRHNHLCVSRACFKRLQQISPSTMDRFRRTERRPAARRHGGTKPGTLLKSQIQIRTFADWDDKRPGFEEIDLVQHDGGNSSGFSLVRWMSQMYARAGPKCVPLPPKHKSMSLRRWCISAAICRFRCSGLTRIMEPNSSTTN